MKVIRPLLGENMGIRRGLLLESPLITPPTPLLRPCPRSQTQRIVAQERWQTGAALAVTSSPSLLGVKSQSLNAPNAYLCVAVVLNSILMGPFAPKEHPTTRASLVPTREQRLLLFGTGTMLETPPGANPFDMTLPKLSVPLSRVKFVSA